MKKNTTKILMAALALFMAIGIATGTTFAWFAMQTTVQATGLEIKAKSNSAFLLIGEEALTTADQIQAQTADPNDLTVEALSVAAPAVYPSKAFGVATAAKDPASVGSAVAVTDKTKAATEGNWYTANSSDPTVWGSTDGKTINAAVLTSFDNYVIKKTVHLTLADGSTNANNLQVKPTITLNPTYNKTTDIAIDGSKTYYTESAGVFSEVGTPVVGDIGTYYEKANDITAVKVLVVSDNNVVAVLSASDNGNYVNLYSGAANSATNNDLTSTSVHEVDIYVYYDGTEAAVYTNNAVNLSGATIDLEFKVAVHE